MKACRACGETKPLADFHLNKTCRDGRVGTCRSCTAWRNRKWYADNRARRQRAANERNRKRKAEAVEQMGGKCHDCGGVFPLSVYDFHHIDGKDVNPSMALTWRKARRDAELDKCVLLCANCHRIRHYEGLD